MTTFEIVISVIGVVLFVYLYCSARTSKNRYEELNKKFDVNVSKHVVYSWHKEYANSQNSSTCNQQLYNNLRCIIDDADSAVRSHISRLITAYDPCLKDLNDCKLALKTLEPVIKYLELKKKIEADATNKENLKKELADLKKQVNDLLK